MQDLVILCFSIFLLCCCFSVVGFGYYLITIAKADWYTAIDYIIHRHKEKKVYHDND